MNSLTHAAPKLARTLTRETLMERNPLQAAICAAIMASSLSFTSAFADTQTALESTKQLPITIRSKGKSEPLTAAQVSGSTALAPDRRVTIENAQEQPGKAVASARFSIDLPNGGLVWATEDPTLGEPVLNITGSSMVAFDNGRIQEPVNFHAYSNYAGFIERLELLIYRGTDKDLVTPLSVHSLTAANSIDFVWDGVLPSNLKFRQGDELQYILRAYAADGSVDETWPQQLQLVRPVDRERNLEEQFSKADSSLRGLSAQELEQRRLLQASYGQGSALRQQNISIYGSKVRVVGQDLPENYQLTINGQSIPVDQERKFVAEYLLPVGAHELLVELSNGKQVLQEPLQIDVSGRHLFLVAIADVTASQNRVSGSVEPLSADDRYEDFLVEGRLGFYLKGKVKGKYLVTAQADTQEQRSGDLFTGFFKADAQDVFRRLDPDAYYPVYGDDSSTTRDIDTQGKLYVRVNWDQNEALWGNFQTGFTGTEYAQYVRSLYGAAVKWRSKESTELGDAKTEIRAFASEAQTELGHSEFLGTGGSLYYLKHTDILRGSDQVVLEMRDPTTGRTEARVALMRDVDYEIDEMQGRLILSRPLLQISRENAPSITRDTPSGGYTNILLVDYEYISPGLSYGEMTGGVRAKQWFGEHFALGGTAVNEKRDADDYTMVGVDATLQAGRGTYLKVEKTHTDSTSATVFYSDNGGLSFSRLNSLADKRDGDAHAVEGRINLKELGVTEREWDIGSWYRNVDSGYSISRFDIGERLIEKGAEFSGEVTEDLTLSGRVSQAERGADQFDQAQLQAEMRILENDSLAVEIRHTREKHRTSSDYDGNGTLGAVRYTHRLTPSLDIYGIGQATLANDGGKYRNNDAFTLGSRYVFGDLSSVSAEATQGARGNAYSVNGEYRVASDHTLYGGYTYSTDNTGETDPMFGGTPGGLTLGQRWRVSNKSSLFNESQWLKSGNDQGIAHTFGMDFYPIENWNYGFTLQKAELEGANGTTKREAVSLRGGHTSSITSWNSAVEWREDTGAERRRQWLTTNRLLHKINEDWRIAGRFNYSDTKDKTDSLQGAKFTESNIGFAWRPADNLRWGLLGKYTYLYDRSTIEQEQSSSFYDQRSHVFALEGTYRFDQRWEFAGKVAERLGEARAGRASGDWYDSRASFAAAQARYRIMGKWNALGEYRWLDVRDGGTRQGWLAGVDRDITDNFRIGAGYNFTDFSDDLTRHDYRYKGWFLNMVGYY